MLIIIALLITLTTPSITMIYVANGGGTKTEVASRLIETYRISPECRGAGANPATENVEIQWNCVLIVHIPVVSSLYPFSDTLNAGVAVG